MILSRHSFLRLSGLPFIAAATRKLTAAVTGKRWAMAVDVAKCQKLPDCTKCIAACHAAHSVPSIPDRRREVRWIWKEPAEHAFHLDRDDYSGLRAAPAMVLCNHCDNPPCARVCPTKATWKREDGIVAMDWHRCIGCRYCMAACPYGSRSFNWMDPRGHIPVANPDYPTRTKGVVEKCTFCVERLAVGRPPACVEACPEKALVFGDLADPQSAIRELLRSRRTMRRKPELGTRPQVFYIV
jgi:molybdopterin-containing oxidoreductase family iron-sulfur binding subunit